jgi:hypothetical protein
MKHLKLILSFVGILISTALLGFITYSWYINIETSNDMRFEILQIQSVVSLYEGQDNNHNGVPDKLSSTNVGKYYNPNVSGGTYISYDKKYYNETYDFKYLDQRYALARDSESNLLNEIIISDCLPSKVYTYKFEIINLATKGNYVSFGFETKAGLDTSYLGDFEVRCGYVSSSGTITFTTWRSFLTGESYSPFNIYFEDTTDIEIPGFSNGVNGSRLDASRLDVWLEIKQKAESTVTLNEYLLPPFRLTLSVDNTLPINEA